MQNDREILSAQMDGEDGGASGTLFSAIAADDEARAVWARYHLIGDVIRDALIEVAPVEFAKQLQVGIDREPTVLAPRKADRSLLRLVAGFAIAASVATLAIVGIKQIAPEQQLNGVPKIATTAPVVPDEALLAVDGTGAQVQPGFDPLEESAHTHRRMNGYLVKFNAQRSSLGVPSVNPYVRIIGFEAD